MGTSGELLLERAAELAAIDDLVRRASTGQGGTIVVRSPAGVGKSALLRAASDRAGVATWRAAGHELEQGYPFGVVLRLLEPMARTLPKTVRDGLFVGAAARVRPLIESGVTEVDDLFGTIHGLYWFVANVAEHETVVLVVDDIQWADVSSIRFLHYLASRAAELRVAVIGSARDDRSATSSDLRALLEHPEVQLLDLAALSEKAVSELIGDDVPPDIRSSAHRLTGGNPLLVQELVENLRSLRDAGETGSHSAVLPTVTTRLRRLSAETQRIAAAAAAVEGAPLALVARVAGVDIERAHEAVAALERAAILASSEPVAFVHPMVRASVIDAVETRDLVAMHAEAALLLDAQGAAAELVAPHLEHAVPIGDRRRVEVLRSAARRASRSGGAIHAVRWLRRALAEGAPVDVGNLSFELARAEALAEDPTWRTRVDDAVARSLDRTAAARELLRLARVLQGTGAVRDAAGVAWRGVELLDDDSALALELLGAYALASQVDIEARRGPLRRLDAALDGRQIDDRARGLLSHLAYERSIAAELPVGEVAALARRAVGATQGTPADVTSVQLPAVLALTWCDELDIASEALAVLRERARSTGDPIAAASAANYAAPISLLCCRPLDAAGEAETALQGFDVGWRLVTPGASGNLALARLELGDLAGAERALELPDDDERWRRGSSFTFWLFAAASVALAAGRLEDAIAALRDCGARQDQMGSVNPMVAPWRSTLALALARAGQLDEAEALAHAELGLAHRFGAPRGVAVAERTLALLGPLDEQVERFERALELSLQSPARIELVRCQVELGAALRRQGSKARATEVLRAALEVAEAGGAAVLARRAREELAATGVRPRSSALRGPAALTPSELRVAVLAAQGRRNREIAEELFVSVKAVEFHLGNCYRKLGVSKRADLERALSA